MEFSVIDGRLQATRAPWCVPENSPTFLGVWVNDERVFRDTGLLVQLFSVYHSPVLVLCMDIPDKSRIAEVERHMLVQSEIPNAFLTFMDYSQEALNCAVAISEKFGRWEHWGIGFTEKEKVEKVIMTCKNDDWPVGQLVRYGLLDYLAIRDFDYDAVYLLTFRDEKFDHFMNFIDQRLSLGVSSYDAQ
jgi:hypothetical protein